VRRMRWCGAVAVLTCVGMLAGGGSATAATPCSSAASAAGEWPVYGHDLSNTRSQPLETGIGPSAAAGLKAAWVFSTSSAGDDSGFESTPVVDHGCVYAGSTGGVVYALDASTGKLLWQRQLTVTTAGLGGAIVGAPVMNGNALIVLVNQDSGPYAIALNRSTGAVIWQSAPFVTNAGYYTNASPVVANGLVVAGYSPPEGDSSGTGGFALLDAGSGSIVKVTPTIPPADQAQGYAGGGLWSTPAYDPRSRYLYFGAGNPNSKTKQHPYTDAVLKIDLSRSRSTFGQIVAAYAGDVDQYSGTLQTLSGTPVCAASDDPSVQYPLDDPACGQLDLDFGAAANLFTDSHGQLLVGDLQKSGVYHVARADTMAPAWTALVGVSCAACNAASTAFDGRAIYGVATPGGSAFSLDRDGGGASWLSPIADGAHYQSVSTAAGVVYTMDGNGNLDMLDAATGATIARHPMALDTGVPTAGATSSGVAIAEHAVFAAATGQPGTGGASPSQSAGYLVAYTP
jgi:polyvinyl alcohol dehydrogenase (cytochrome)